MGRQDSWGQAAARFGHWAPSRWPTHQACPGTRCSPAHPPRPLCPRVHTCREAGVPLLVDGAHAAGCLPDLCIPALGADYYTTNLHKWCCTPKGAALLWVAPARQAGVRPLVISHGYRLGFRGEFLWQGTQDMSAWLAAPAALAVLRAVGVHGMAARNVELVQCAARGLMQRWGTTRALGIPPQPPPTQQQQPDGAAVGGALAGASGQPSVGKLQDKRTAASTPAAVPVAAAVVPMVAVELPADLARRLPEGPAGAAELHARLRREWRIEVPVVCAAGALWVRLSAQIHNEEADYARLGDAVAAMAGVCDS